jgi:hypothetical protein
MRTTTWSSASLLGTMAFVEVLKLGDKTHSRFLAHGPFSYSLGECFLTFDRIGELCLVCESVLGLFPGAI